MLHIFQYNNASGQVESEKGQILLIREFAALMDDKRNVSKLKIKPGKKHLRATVNLLLYTQLQTGNLFIKILRARQTPRSFKDADLSEEEWTILYLGSEYKEIQESNVPYECLKQLRGCR